MTTWLSKKLRNDLEALADSADLTYAKADNKATLVAALDDHLRANADKFRSVPAFSEYYRTSRSVSGGDGKPKGKRTTKGPSELLSEAASEVAAAVTPAPNQAAHRTPQRARASSGAALTTTPQRISQSIQRTTTGWTRKFRRFYRDTTVTEGLEIAHEKLSTVSAILSAFLLFELYSLGMVTLPWQHLLTIPAVAFLGPVRISFPDPYLVFTSYWFTPALLWSLTSLIIPAAAGWLVNLTAANEGRSTRRHKAYYSIDPLVFAIAKAATTWLVYSKGVRFGGLFNNFTVRSVENSIPYGWFGIVLGSVVGVVASLYEAALRK